MYKIQSREISTDVNNATAAPKLAEFELKCALVPGGVVSSIFFAKKNLTFLAILIPRAKRK